MTCRVQGAVQGHLGRIGVVVKKRKRRNWAKGEVESREEGRKGKGLSFREEGQASKGLPFKHDGFAWNLNQATAGSPYYMYMFAISAVPFSQQW